ncbi:unnamed protein product [Allacma fusca]|uniref:Uncharacterized protein n=1 Tax=Allacma fusca TaxID=39272 RepID=A0A8J2LHR7_9HEXA|nr:unnamed protein product [Allacma fusca]
MEEVRSRRKPQAGVRLLQSEGSDRYGTVGDDESTSSFVRSLSMSRNLALSMYEEMPHVIQLNSGESLVNVRYPLKKSSSASSLTRLLLLNDIADQEEPANPSVSRRIPSNPAPSTSFAQPKVSNSQSVPYPHVVPEVLEAESLADSIAKLEMRAISDEASVKNLIGGKRNDLLVGIVVSRWDNIVGPQCVYLWTEERTSTFYPLQEEGVFNFSRGNLPTHLSRLVKYVTEHTVDHQDVDGNLVLPSMLRSTLCIVRDLDLAYLSVSIRVPLDPDTESTFGFSHLGDRNRPAATVPHAVAVLANLQYLNHFLLLRPLVLNWLSEFAPKIGVLLCKGQLQSSMINSWCAELCKTMTALRTCWGQESHAKSVDLIPQGNQLTVSNFDDSTSYGLDYLPPSFIAKPVLESLLFSYLTTFGSAIIVGEDALVVNQVIRFLLSFASDQEAYCSRYVLPTLPDTFMKGLYVQGLMLGEIGAKSVSYNQVTSNKYPFTHVEISKKQVKVRQSNIQTHRTQREAILKDELSALWNSSALGSSTIEPFSTLLKEGNGFINTFLEELRSLRPERRYCRLLLFKRSLHAKAISLIAYLESIRLKPPKDRAKLLKVVTQALGINESEYSVVQVAAERIRPGIQAIIRSKFSS